MVSKPDGGFIQVRKWYILAVIVIFAFIATYLTIFQANEIQYETIMKDSFAWQMTGGNYVITNQSDWKSLWDELWLVKGPYREPPEVDFDSKIVIATFMGNRGTGGYSIKIERIIETVSQIVVYISKSSPGAGAYTTQTATGPFHIVKINKTTKDIILRDL